MFWEDPDPDTDPLFLETDLRIRIHIQIKWIYNPECSEIQLFATIPGTDCDRFDFVGLLQRGTLPSWYCSQI